MSRQSDASDYAENPLQGLNAALAPPGFADDVLLRVALSSAPIATAPDNFLERVLSAAKHNKPLESRRWFVLGGLLLLTSLFTVMLVRLYFGSHIPVVLATHPDPIITERADVENLPPVQVVQDSRYPDKIKRWNTTKSLKFVAGY